MQPYTPPTHAATSFNCPFCGSYAHQQWYNGYGSRSATRGTTPKNFEMTRCTHCEEHTFWLDGKMIYPTGGSAPLPHAEMPEDVKRDYNEARMIVAQSPRSAAALLRLAVQKLSSGILGVDENSKLNDTIKKLVENGLPKTVQQALDFVRVIGNNAVHPGQIDMRDNVATATKLFDLVNIITDYMIAKPKEIGRLYDKLPEKEKDNIAKRDTKSK